MNVIGWPSSPGPLVLAAARNELSAMLVLRGEAASARRRCLTGAGQAGDMEGFARRARAELLATGERARRRGEETKHCPSPEAGRLSRQTPGL
jgi:hypothetical protein